MIATSSKPPIQWLEVRQYTKIVQYGKKFVAAGVVRSTFVSQCILLFMIFFGCNLKNVQTSKVNTEIIYFNSFPTNDLLTKNTVNWGR